MNKTLSPIQIDGSVAESQLWSRPNPATSRTWNHVSELGQIPRGSSLTVSEILQWIAPYASGCQSAHAAKFALKSGIAGGSPCSSVHHLIAAMIASRVHTFLSAPAFTAAQCVQRGSSLRPSEPLVGSPQSTHGDAYDSFRALSAAPSGSV